MAFKIFLCAAIAVLAAAQLDPDLPILEKTTRYMNQFPDPKEMARYYDENAVINFPTFLPFGGVHEGQEEISRFFHKMMNSLVFNARQYEIKYLDGRTGRAGVYLRLKDGRFRGRVLDRKKRRFDKPGEYVDLFNHLEFDPATGKILSHDIQLLNSEEVFEKAAPQAMQMLKKLQTEIFNEEEISESSKFMDLIDDDVELHVSIDPQWLTGNKTKFVGKEALLEFAQRKFDSEDEDEDEEDETKDKKKQAHEGEEETRTSAAREESPRGSRGLLEAEQDDTKDEEQEEAGIADYSVETLFADDFTVYKKVSVNQYQLPNGQVLKDFDVYRVYKFNQDGKLISLGISFSRPFEPWELSTMPAVADSEKSESEEPKNNRRLLRRVAGGKSVSVSKTTVNVKKGGVVTGRPPHRHHHRGLLTRVAGGKSVSVSKTTVNVKKGGVVTGRPPHRHHHRGLLFRRGRAAGARGVSVSRTTVRAGGAGVVRGPLHPVGFPHHRRRRY